jgi:short-chain fatty acids transporter
MDSQDHREKEAITAIVPPPEATTPGNNSVASRTTAFVVYIVEQFVPDPFVFAVILTCLTAAMAFVASPQVSVGLIGIAWYNGVFSILSFAFQMVLILVTGYALATSPPVKAIVDTVAGIPKNSRDAVSLTLAVSLSASWVNWGFGLVTAGLLSRAIARKIPLDFGWLVAAAYTGFVLTPEGISGSIALSQATPGSSLNLLEQMTGKGLPLTQTIFAPFTLFPVLALFFLLPVLFRYIEPPEASAVIVPPERLIAEHPLKRGSEHKKSIGEWLDDAWILNVFLALCAASGLISQWRTTHFSIDINSVILIFLILGVMLHRRPIAYVDAIKNAARITGPLILLYPLYGGIMGIMTATGLAAVISTGFLKLATARTLPFWTYISSVIITFFIPSGGGHWAVQGPFVLPAARALRASLPRTTMAVAMGESVGNMIQPFFALPVLAIAGIGMRRILAFMLVTFLTALVVFGISLLWMTTSSL